MKAAFGSLPRYWAAVRAFRGVRCYYSALQVISNPVATGAPIVKRPQPNPHSRKVPPRLAASPNPPELAEYAKHVRYVGSGEHKSAPWHGMSAASPREKDANRCPTHLTLDQATAMLKAGILAGNISEEFVGEFPKRVWYKGAEGTFEARLTDRADLRFGKPAGYKGWPEDPDKLPTKPREVKTSDAL